MRKKLKISIWVLFILFILINYIAMFNMVAIVDNEKSEILKEYFDLPDYSKVFATIIPKFFFRPTYKIVYIDDIILIKDTGKLGEVENKAFSILGDMMDDDIFQHIWIFNLLSIVTAIILLIIYKVKYLNEKR